MKNIGINYGVDISRLNREIRRALGVCKSIYDRHGSDLFVTSTFEGNHGAGSLHYSHDAFDIARAPENNYQITLEIQRKLGVKYDVVAETTHNHIEYDPKTATQRE